MQTNKTQRIQMITMDFWQDLKKDNQNGWM